MNNDWPPKFSLDQENILNLLTGDRFYSNPSAALREGVLNAIDAVFRRKIKDQNFTPKIELIFNEDQNSITIKDNGIGMGQADITELFTKVGASAANKESNKQSVGEFGIGVNSYFMAGDSFELHTFDEISESIGLKFDKSMLSGGNAIVLDSIQSTRGTTIILSLKDENTFNLLIDRFPYWCRDVSELTASQLPSGKVLPQGGTKRTSEQIDVLHPNWIEKSHLNPVYGFVGWDAMTGHSKIFVLYRGVFVQEFNISGVWGIEGSIDVDPKYFKPKLNRESFIEGQFQQEVETFLKSIHPTILNAMADKLLIAIQSKSLSKWGQKRWASFWLSVPRTGIYLETSKKWDNIFRNLPSFEIAKGTGWQPINLNDIIKIKTDIYVAPLAEDKTNDIITSAERLVRNSGRVVIRGIKKDRGWMRHSLSSFNTTADLITQVFQQELPHLINIANSADQILSEIKNITKLFSGPPSIELIQFGVDGAPILKLNKKLIINIDNPKAKIIVQEIIESNSGPMSLIGLTAIYAYDQLAPVASIIKDLDNKKEILSPIRRRYIKGFLK